MVRVGHPLVICEVSSGSPQGAEGREREKPCRLSIDSIAKVSYWPRFLLNAYEERHKASYRGTADPRLYQDSSVAMSHCQREKQKRYTQQATIGTPRKGGSVCFINTYLSYKLSVKKLFQSRF